MLGPHLESLPCTQLSTLLLMRAGKLVYRCLKSALQRALACWAAEAMLQFLFLLLHKLRALQQTPTRTAAKGNSDANQRSSACDWKSAFAPSSGQQSQVPGRISDMTYAEVPLSSVAQVKAQIGKPSIVPLIQDNASHSPAAYCLWDCPDPIGCVVVPPNAILPVEQYLQLCCRAPHFGAEPAIPLCLMPCTFHVAYNLQVLACSLPWSVIT